jgi:hypothetical protein
VNDITAKVLLALVIGVPIVIGALGIMWFVWALWLGIAPGLFAGGPDMLLYPTFWQFIAALVLIRFIGWVLFSK